MVVRAAPLGSDPDVPDTRVLGAEVIRENVDFADGFQRRLAFRRRTENAAVGFLPVQREVRPITLGTEEFESPVRIRLRDVRGQKEKRVRVTANSGQLDDGPIRNRIADGLVVHVDKRSFRGHCR